MAAARSGCAISASVSGRYGMNVSTRPLVKVPTTWLPQSKVPRHARKAESIST